MTTQPKPDLRSFGFRSRNGKGLTQEIANIERLATERLRAGIADHSVQTGALALLKIALEGVSSEISEVAIDSIQIQACTSPINSSRCIQPEI